MRTHGKPALTLNCALCKRPFRCRASRPKTFCTRDCHGKALRLFNAWIAEQCANNLSDTSRSFPITDLRRVA
jgi:hypothetical protein